MRSTDGNTAIGTVQRHTADSGHVKGASQSMSLSDSPSVRWTRRRVVAAGVVAAGALPAAACGPGQTAQTPAASQQPKKIGFHTDWVTTERGETIRLALEQWKREHPNVTVDKIEYVSGVGTNPREQVVAAMNAGTEGDVALWAPADVALWASRNAFADIKPVLGKLKVKLDDYLYLQDAIIYQGKQVGMPFQINFKLAWSYNRTLFQRYGVPEPKDAWTWDEVINTAKRMTHPDQNLWGIGQRDDTYFLMAYELGGKIISDDYKKTLWDSPEGLAALEFHYGLIHRHRVMPTIAEASAKKLTWQNYGIILECPTPRGLLKQAADFQSDFDYAPLMFQANAKRRLINTFDQPHVVLAAANRHNVLEEAARFVVFMAGDFVGDLFAKLLPFQWPSRKAVINSPQFLVNPPRNSKRLLDGFKYERVPGYPLFPYAVEWLTAWRRPHGDALLNGQYMPREAAQLMSAAGDAVLATRAQTILETMSRNR